MKTTIAYKSHGAGILYLVFFFIGVGLSVFGLGASFLPLFFAGMVFVLYCGYQSVVYLRLPGIIIVHDGDKLILPKNTLIALKDVLDVSYRRATGRGIQYSYGSLTITTHLETYKFHFVAQCESASKELIRLIYEAKSYTGQENNHTLQ